MGVTQKNLESYQFCPKCEQERIMPLEWNELDHCYYATCECGRKFIAKIGTFGDVGRFD